MLEICGSFVCRYNVDDYCNDDSLCGDCIYFDCDNCVYHVRVSEFADYCDLQENCDFPNAIL